MYTGQDYMTPGVARTGRASPTRSSSRTTPCCWRWRQGRAAAAALTGLRDRVAAAGYTYREEELADAHPELGTGTLGYTDPAAKVIVVDPRLSPHQKASTIAHELGHVHVGHVDAAPGEYPRHTSSARIPPGRSESSPADLPDQRAASLVLFTSYVPCSVKMPNSKLGDGCQD